RHRQADRRVARRKDLGEIGARPWVDLSVRPARQGRAADGGRMSKRILVIEDQEDNRTILRDLLTSVGYELIEATNGEEGVKLAERETPDVLWRHSQPPVTEV